MTGAMESTPRKDASPAFAARGAGDSYATKAGAPRTPLHVRGATEFVVAEVVVVDAQLLAHWLAADPGSPT
jgi:hypothetical protein